MDNLDNQIDTGYDRVNERSVNFRLRVESLNSKVDTLKTQMQDKTDLVLGFLDKLIND